LSLVAAGFTDPVAADWQRDPLRIDDGRGGPMSFSFSPEQRQQLFAALGRDDSGAWHLTEDVELALDAYGEPGQVAGAVLAPVVTFAHTLEQIKRLRSELYGLPEQIRQWAVMGAIGNDDAAEVGRLAQAGGEALDQLSARLARIDVSESAPAMPRHTVAELFLHALGQSFRNRLNIKPTSDPKGLFRRFLDALMVLVRRRHADLDDLAQVLTPERLELILDRG